ncbi:MAG TPA: hypothetical protein PKK60_01685 [archaeon]|nr:hypothetical protein [archaeon]
MNTLMLDIFSQYIYGFAFFNPWGSDWFGLLYSCILLYLFVWVGKTGRVEKISEDIADDLAPGFVLAMFITLIGLPNLIATIVLFISWLLKIKDKEEMKHRHWIRLCVQFFLIMGVGIFLDPSINWIWMIILLGIFYIKNKLELKIDKRDEKEKKSEKK